MILGPIVISPARRTISGFGGRALLEPRMVQVLLCLVKGAGGLVTREQLLDRCWNGTPVGDDSLNRAIAGRRAAIAANVEAAARGPAQSVAAIIHLGGIGAVDEGLDAAEAYLARQGAIAVSQRRTITDPSVTDQHRRITQMLFIPATQSLRASPRFDDLCDAIGLEDYWRRAGISPDR